jgi:formylmethanofuran--tetrahydromethanopterin N-formyltransferase
VAIDDTFAEAFDMKATRIIITAADQPWVHEAAASMTGFASSVIACGAEIGIERWLRPEETPDGRDGVAVLAFAMSGGDLEKEIPRRAGQCVLTCPTTALYAGIEGNRDAFPKRVPLGQSLRYFGDGHQISKVIDGRRYWRVPVMDGEFVCQHDVPRIDGIGGGNFILLGTSIESVSRACRAAIDAMRPLEGIITPFPGGVTRSGSKVGSKYKGLFASTNDAFCPSLKRLAPSALGDDVRAVLEVVIDGVSTESIAASMRIGIEAACREVGRAGLVQVTAGNYGGKLGRHHFQLGEIMT